MCGQAVKEEEKLANPGVKLDVSRVGKSVSYLEDANVGETIQFEYQGGSDVGGTRTVLVQAVEGEGIKGATLERDGAFRSYLDRNRIGTVAIVSPFVKDKDAEVAPAPAIVGSLVENRVRFDAAKSALLAVLTAEQLAALYQQHVAKDSKGVSYDASKGELVVKTEPPKPTFHKGSITEAHKFGVKGPKGTVNVFVYEGGQIGIDHDDNKGHRVFAARSVTPADLAKALSEVLA